MTGIIILAAGSSSRFGSPKQNLIYEGKTLLQRAIQTALTSACCDYVLVVLGANEHEIRSGISDQQVHITYNPDWQTGMASSIKQGVSTLQELEPRVNNIILTLCDQPFVDPLLLYQLTQRQAENDHGIVACEYKNTLGAPALFNKKYFGQLKQLSGTEGAKSIISRYPDDVVSVPFALGAIDIDTIDDFEHLNQF